MTVNELIEEFKIKPNYNKLPRFIKVDDINNSQVLIEGKWQNSVYSWGIIKKNNEWVYFETDYERGYISYIKNFSDEDSACEFVKKSFELKLKSLVGNSKYDMAVRYIQKTYSYSEKRASDMVKQMSIHNDIFEEFFNYIRIGKFHKKDKTKISIEGITAEELANNYKLSPLGVYNYLVYLREEPKEALEDLKNRVPKK